MARAQHPSEPELQGQNLLWLMGDAADKGPLQARLHGKAEQSKIVRHNFFTNKFLFIFFKCCHLPYNILELVQIMLVLPISAAQCERGFSAQNHIKNSTRSCLGVSTTEDLMRISLEGPSLEQFDPSPAVDRWLSSKQARRPAYKSCLNGPSRL